MPIFGKLIRNGYVDQRGDVVHLPFAKLIFTHKWKAGHKGHSDRYSIPLLTSPLKGEEHSDFPPLQGEGWGGGGDIGSKCEMVCRLKIPVFTLAAEALQRAGTGMTHKYALLAPDLNQLSPVSLCPEADLWDTISSQRGVGRDFRDQFERRRIYEMDY